MGCRPARSADVILFMKIAFLFFLSLADATAYSFVGKLAQQSETEKSKIEYLLHEVESLQGVKFWRNGSSYDTKAAADHLRMKWKKAGSAIKTAKDFIEKIGSESSVSGKAYQIEFKDGKKVETRTFFYQKLGAWKP
jgi:hypothetical protein